MRHGIFAGLVILAGCSTSAPSPVAPTDPASPSSSIAIGPPAPSASPATCSDSTQCAAGALCCPSVSTKMPASPFGPPPGQAAFICTTDPVRDCGGHEVCGREPCRSPWPPSHSGQVTPSRTYVEECGTSRDCPKDAVCTLYYNHPPFSSSFCAYNVTGEAEPTFTAPLCQTDADCKAALPRWKSILGDGYAKALDGARCVPLHTLSDTRRACAVPGLAPLP